MSTLTIRLPDETENHFCAMAATGDVRKAQSTLDRLDAVDQ